MSAIYAKRCEAVSLCTHARGPHLSYSAAAKVLKKSKHIVQMWVKRYRDIKTVDDLPGKGETRATSSKEDKMIVALFKRNPTLRLREVKAELAEKGLHVSINTIRRRLAEAKLQYSPTRQKSVLFYFMIYHGKTTFDICKRWQRNRKKARSSYELVRKKRKTCSRPIALRPVQTWYCQSFLHFRTKEDAEIA